MQWVAARLVFVGHGLRQVTLDGQPDEVEDSPVDAVVDTGAGSSHHTSAAVAAVPSARVGWVSGMALPVPAVLVYTAGTVADVPRTLLPGLLGWRSASEVVAPVPFHRTAHCCWAREDTRVLVHEVRHC